MPHRQVDRYIQALIDADRFSFYQALVEFSDTEVGTQILNWERSGEFVPDSLISKMGELGLFGLPIDARYGGQGGGLTELILMGLALGYHSQSVAITPGAAVSLGSKPVEAFGNEKQKQEHLPDLASGRRMFVFGLSEPGRGSDAANPEVVAEKTASGWRIRGEKCWSTNAKWASHVIVHALTDPGGRNGHRSTCFIVPMDSPNVHYQEMAGKTAWKQSSTGSIAFDGTEVGPDDVLGELNEGFRVMVNTLNGGRLFIASLALASTAFALDRVRTYAQERVQFQDQPIARFQRVQDVVLELDVLLERNLTWLLSLAERYDRGDVAQQSAAKVKIDSSRAASRLMLDAMEICGGVACLDEFGLARHHNDLFVTRVGEGSNRALATFAVRPLFDQCGSILQ